MVKEKKTNYSLIAFTLLVKSTKLLKAFKAVKILKPLITLFSMTLSVAVYAFAYSPWFAVGLVGMLFVHEMGHVMALRRKGIPASAPIFIPMLGAVIFAPKMENPEDEAYVGYAGPLVGGAAALLLFLLALLFPTPPKMLVITSYLATFLNLFNLIPIRPLDGGRVTQIIGRWFRWLGAGLILAFTLVTLNPGLFLIWIIILNELPMKWRMIAILGVACQVGMMILIFSGISHQGIWVDVIDVIAATMINGLYVVRACCAKEFEEETEDPETEVASAVRNKWLVLYLLLTAALTALLVLQLPYLPKNL